MLKNHGLRGRFREGFWKSVLPMPVGPRSSRDPSLQALLPELPVIWEQSRRLAANRSRFLPKRNDPSRPGCDSDACLLAPAEVIARPGLTTVARRTLDGQG